MEYAKYCYNNYPTIVNNIPKESNIYDNTLHDFARMDNSLAAAQLAIGESSNLAQLALTYSYNFDDQKFKDYVCILSVVAQIAIDNAKRRSDIDLVSEIKRIKKDMDIGTNKYPKFWQMVKKDFNNGNINHSLRCPMNELFTALQIAHIKPPTTTLPMKDFFIKYNCDNKSNPRRTCRKVEEIITRYSLQIKDGYDDYDDILLRSNFDDMIQDLRQVYLSKNYIGLMSWLLDRAFKITPCIRQNLDTLSTNTDKNKSILIKVLYDINPTLFLKCWSKNI